MDDALSIVKPTSMGGMFRATCPGREMDKREDEREARAKAVAEAAAKFEARVKEQSAAVVEESKVHRDIPARIAVDSIKRIALRMFKEEMALYGCKNIAEYDALMERREFRDAEVAKAGGWIAEKGSEIAEMVRGLAGKKIQIAVLDNGRIGFTVYDGDGEVLGSDGVVLK